MTEYLKKSFSVGMASDEKYRNNWDNIFQKKSDEYNPNQGVSEPVRELVTDGTPLKNVLIRIVAERARQERLKANGKFAYTCADPEYSLTEKLTVLAEEFGETSREVCELMFLIYKNPEDLIAAKVKDKLIREGKHLLRKELIETAAVAIAWCEALETELSNDE